MHDEIGQTLTAVLLELKHVADQTPPPMRAAAPGAGKYTKRTRRDPADRPAAASRRPRGARPDQCVEGAGCGVLHRRAHRAAPSRPLPRSGQGR
ncbi:hypothetical protein [Dactylosporangium cerinum]